MPENTIRKNSAIRNFFTVKRITAMAITEHNRPESSTRVLCGFPFRNQIVSILSVSVMIAIRTTS